MTRACRCALLLCVSASCRASEVEVLSPGDAGVADTLRADGGPRDLGTADGGVADGGVADVEALDAGRADAGPLVSPSWTLRFREVTRTPGAAEIPEPYRDRSPFVGLTARLDTVDPEVNGATHAVRVFFPFGLVSGRLEGFVARSGSASLSTDGCVRRCRPALTANDEQDVRLVVQALSAPDAEDPAGPGWRPGATATLSGRELYTDADGAQIDVAFEALVDVLPDETRPQVRFRAAPRGVLLPWEAVQIDLSEPLAELSRPEAEGTATILRPRRLEPVFGGGIASAAVEGDAQLWRAGQVRLRYGGRDLDLAGNPASASASVYERVADPRPVPRVDFQDPAATPPRWGTDAPAVAAALCVRPCLALEIPAFPGAAGAYLRLRRERPFTAVRFSVRHVNVSCEGGVGNAAGFAVRTHVWGQVPVQDTVNAAPLIAEPTRTTPGYACDSGWQTRSVALVGSSTDIGLVFETGLLSLPPGEGVLLVEEVVPSD